LTVHSVLLGFAGLNVHFFSLMQYCRRNIVQAVFAIIFPKKEQHRSGCDDSGCVVGKS